MNTNTQALPEAAKFQREDRYIVLKIKDLEQLNPVLLEELTGTLSAIANLTTMPRREFVVIESDWPEYEPVWKMLEARVNGERAALSHPPAPEQAGVEREDSQRLHWLHSEASNNVDGYEWGIYRVKRGEFGKVDEMWHTYSDFSDLDAAMALAVNTKEPTAPQSLLKVFRAAAYEIEQQSARLGSVKFDKQDIAGQLLLLSRELTDALATPTAEPAVEPQQETDAELLLRELASYLGVGGYNATTVDVETFRRKIYDGIRVYSNNHGIAARDLAEQELDAAITQAEGAMK